MDNKYVTMATVVARPADVGFVASLARVLMKLVGESNGTVGIVTLFHAVNEPNISIGEYITRIARYAGCSTECFVLCLVYIDRIVRQHKNFVISVLNIHRLVITSVMIAAKFYDDLYYSNSFYAKIGGVKTTEINLLEAHFLSLIDFDLYVSGIDYEICRSKVANSEWWSLECLNISKLMNLNNQRIGASTKTCKSIYSIKSDSISTSMCDPIPNCVHRADKNEMLQRIDTTYRNDNRVKVDNKLQQIHHLSNGQREKFQYNIARYNESFCNRYDNNEFKSRPNNRFDNHNTSNNGISCTTSSSVAPATGSFNNGNNVYEMNGQSNLQNLYLPAYTKHNSQQVKQREQLLDRYYSVQSSIPISSVIPGICQKQQYQHGINSQQIRHLQQLQLRQLQLYRRDIIERQSRNIQNTTAIKHPNHIPLYPCQQQHNYHAYNGCNNSVSGYNKCINKMIRRDFDCWSGEVRGKPQYRRSITRHVSDRPVPIGCPSFQGYDY